MGVAGGFVVVVMDSGTADLVGVEPEYARNGPRPSVAAGQPRRRGPDSASVAPWTAARPGLT